MAVNLLGLARASSAGLHNSGRGSGRSYAPGTTYGNKIAGTNIKQGSGLTNLASKGRGGDTKIRKVAGRPSHVNKREASAIDRLGPLGEAWVQSIGSGTINPKTGLKEFKPFWKRKIKNMFGSSSRWRPSDGKWGVFGQTGKSKARDQSKADAAVRHANFEQFRRDNEDQNIAGIFTEDTTDDTLDNVKEESGYNTWLKNQSGMEMSDTDIADYTDPYDTRKEEEIEDNEAFKMDEIDLAQQGTDVKNVATGTGASSGLFGLLSQSKQADADADFSGKGDFTTTFAETQHTKELESQFGATELDRQKLELDRKQVTADAEADRKDLHDEYNQEFWNNMVSWDTAVNA